MENPITLTQTEYDSIKRGTEVEIFRLVATDSGPQSEDTFMNGFPETPVNVRMCGDYAKCDAPKGSMSVSYRVYCPYGWIHDTLDSNFGIALEILSVGVTKRDDGWNWKILVRETETT